MRLWLQRSETRDRWGRIGYRLRLALEVDEVEAEIIERHGVADMELWVSPAALLFEADADRLIAGSDAAGGWNFHDMLHGIGAHRQALQALRDADDEARLTVGDLLGGAELEADEVSELLAVEAGVRAAFEPLQGKVAALASFEDDSEFIIEPEPVAPATSVAAWLSQRRR